MRSIDFEESNPVLGAPKGHEEDVHPLPVYTDGHTISVSCWEPDEEELEIIMREKKIWLIVMGNIHPPVAIQGGSPLKNVNEN